MDDKEKSRVGTFITQLVMGAADLGLGALPLVKLYNQAKAEKISFSDMLIKDPQATEELVQAFRRQAKRLPPHIISLLEQVVQEARK